MARARRTRVPTGNRIKRAGSRAGLRAITGSNTGVSASTCGMDWAGSPVRLARANREPNGLPSPLAGLHWLPQR